MSPLKVLIGTLCLFFHCELELLRRKNIATYHPCSCPSACTSSNDTPDTGSGELYRPRIVQSPLGIWKGGVQYHWLIYCTRKALPSIFTLWLFHSSSNDAIFHFPFPPPIEEHTAQHLSIEWKIIPSRSSLVTSEWGIRGWKMVSTLFHCQRPGQSQREEVQHCPFILSSLGSVSTPSCLPPNPVLHLIKLPLLLFCSYLCLFLGLHLSLCLLIP